MKNLIYIITIFVLTFSLPYCFVNQVSAGDIADQLKEAGETSGPYSPTAATGTEKRMAEIVGAIIKAALTLLGVLFLILMVYGGYLWMMAHGSEEQVTKAKNVITRAVIGLIIVIAAYAITFFIYEYIIGGSKALQTS